MVHIIFVIAVVCAVAVGRDAASQPVSQCGLRLLLIVCAGWIPCLTAKMVAAVATERIQLARLPLEKADTRNAGTDSWWHERLILVVWVLVSAFLIFVADWVTIVRTNWGWQHAILGDEFLILFPLITPWLICWAYLFDIEQRGSGANANGVTRRSAQVAFVGRQLGLVVGLGLTPILSICLLVDVVNAVAPDLLHGPLANFIYLSPLIVVLIAYPYLLICLWNLTPLPDGPCRTRLVGLAERANVSVRDLLVWNTEGQIINAATSGVARGCRFVLFTDRLLAIASDRELDAILLHELAHARLQHVLSRTLALLLPFSLMVIAANLHRWIGGDSSTPTSDHASLATYLGMAGTLLFMGSGLGWYSRMLEHEADLWACEQMRSEGVPETLTCYLSVLQKMHRGMPAEGRGWLHPGWQARFRFLQRMVDNPIRKCVFRRRMVAISVTIRGLFLLAVIATLLTWGLGRERSLPEPPIDTTLITDVRFANPPVYALIICPHGKKIADTSSVQGGQYFREGIDGKHSASRETLCPKQQAHLFTKLPLQFNKRPI